MRILTSHTQTIQFIALTRRPNPAKFLATLFIPILLSACGGGGGSSTAAPATPIAATPAPTPVAPATDPLDDQLLPLVEAEGLIGDAAFNRTLPTINDAEAQLGKLLFFSKSLGGDFDVACVTCHHPMLGGGDALSLPVGVGAEQPNLLGPGRIPDPTTSTDGLPNVPRNSPTVFNIGLWDSGLFHDSRVESFGKEEFANGAGSDIRTPDTAFGIADVNAGANLVAAQARFPVTSQEEMRGETFEAGNSNDAVRRHLAARVGNYAEGLGELLTNTWLTEFQTAFNSTADAETLITFDNITRAIATYERSMVFTNNAFAQYIAGDLTALTDPQKRGAILFYTSADDGGGHCSTCHSGDRFTDEEHHTVAFPQFGHGKGNGTTTDDDFARERETGNQEDRYRFRTPTLLNVAVTGPFGHAGTYETLNQVMNHYNNPRATVDDFFDDGGACTLEQFEDISNCNTLYPNAQAHSDAALDKLNDERNNNTSDFPNLNLNNNERADLAAFLQSLTDPCVLDRDCLAPWIADDASLGPDNQQLNAVDINGNPL